MLDRLKEFVLALETAVNVTDRQISGFCDRSHRETIDAVFSQDFFRGLHNLGQRGAAALLLRPQNVRGRIESRHDDCPTITSAFIQTGCWPHLLHQRSGTWERMSNEAWGVPVAMRVSPRD